MVVRQRHYLLFCLGLTLFLTSCASQNYFSKKGHEHFKNKDYEQAALTFEKEIPEAKSNVVLYRLDAAISRFRMGDYKKAIEHLLVAEKESEIKDYTSVSEEVGTLLTSDNVRGYKGEDHEKLLINIYLALSFAALGDLDGARVEARKINLLMTRLLQDGKRGYAEWPLARYLSAMLWEYERSYDNAYINYKKVYELNPEFPGIVTDLVTLAKKNRDQDEHQMWTKKYPDARLRQLSKSGEWVVFLESGRAPKKTYRPEDPTLPYIRFETSDVKSFRLRGDGFVHECRSPVLDVARVARDSLEDRMTRMKLAKVAGVVAKFATAELISKATDNESLGFLTYLILLLSDQADLRSWTSLPRELFMCRFDQIPASGQVNVELLDHKGVILDSFSRTWMPRVNSKSPAQFWIISQ